VKNSSRLFFLILKYSGSAIVSKLRINQKFEAKRENKDRKLKE